VLGKQVQAVHFVCSHPHEDHLGGIVTFVQDPRLATVPTVTFTASDDLPNNLSLKFTVARTGVEPVRTFLAREPGDDSKQIHDVLGKVTAEGVRLEALEYTPTSIHEHGNALVVLATLSDAEGNTATVLLTDDADPAVLQRAAAWLRSKGLTDERRLTAVVGPHHGSNKNDPSALLADDIRPKAWIVPVNEFNKHRHPSPSVMESVFKAVTPENTYLSGLDDNHVRVTPRGVQGVSAADRYEDFLIRFVEKPENYFRERAAMLEARARSFLPETTASERARVQQAQAEIAAAERLRARKHQRREIVAVTPDNASHPSRGVPPDHQPSDRGGGLGRGDDSGSGGIAGGPNGGGKGPSGTSTTRAYAPEDGNTQRGGTGSSSVDFKKKVAQSRARVGGNDPVPPGQPMPGGSRNSRIRLREEGLKVEPDFGGIMVSGAYDAEASISPLSSSVAMNGDVATISVRYKGDDGKEYTATLRCSSTELFTAYRFVVPTAAMEDALGGAGVTIGIVSTEYARTGVDASWHPALDATHVLVEAIRLDGWIPATVFQDPTGETAKLLPKRSPFNYSLQWYDVESVIRVRDSAIVVDPKSGADDRFLAVRFWRPEELKRNPITKKLVLASGAPVEFDDTKLTQNLRGTSAYRIIERWSRIVTVLHWLHDKDQLFDLPVAVSPIRVNVPEKWTLAEILRPEFEDESDEGPVAAAGGPATEPATTRNSAAPRQQKRRPGRKPRLVAERPRARLATRSDESSYLTPVSPM
jgi:beta-lactamase superfamily II metal-dependent hydrolase